MIAPVAIAAAPAAAPADDRARREFDAMVASHLPALRSRAAQLCRRHLDPDDILQDALVRALRARTQVRDHDKARSWLLTIVTNTFLDAVRKQRTRPGQVSIEDAPVAADEPRAPLPWQRITDDHLRAAIDRLPDDVRDTYRMFALEGRDYIAIAEVQAIPKATVGTRLARARRKLRALLAIHTEEDAP